MALVQFFAGAVAVAHCRNRAGAADLKRNQLVGIGLQTSLYIVPRR